MATGVASNRATAWARAFALAGVVVALDQITKQVAVSSIGRGERIEIIFGLELANVRNEGVAFGVLAGGEVPVLLLTLGALVALFTYFAFHAGTPGLWVAVGLICGGAIGNLADRIRIDAVIDFLDPPAWPAFNLADVAIVAGVVFLILTLGVADRGESG